MFLKESVIIEFNGLPATGKTTIANHLTSILDQAGIQYRRSYLRHRWAKNGRTVFIEPTCIPLFHKLLRFARQIKPRHSRLTHIVGEMYHYRNYRDFFRDKRSVSALIIDQGIIQSIISIAHLDRIEQTDSLQQVFEYYKKKNIRFVRVDCLVNEETAYERIIHRPKNSARLYDQPHQGLLSAMKTQADNFRLVRQIFHECCPEEKNIELNTLLPPEENANLIINKLIEYGIIAR